MTLTSLHHQKGATFWYRGLGAAILGPDQKDATFWFDDREELWRPGIGASRAQRLSHAQVFDGAQDALDAMLHARPLAARPTTISAAALATHAKAGGAGGLHRVRGEGRGGQRGAALAPARPASPFVGPAQRQRSFATIPRRSRAMVATPSPARHSHPRDGGARAFGASAHVRRAAVSSAAPARPALSHPAPRAARRGHAMVPDPRGSPPDPSPICFTKAGQPSLAATRPWGGALT